MFLLPFCIYHFLLFSLYYKKGQHRSCHTAKCNMLNKWLKTKKNIYTGHSYFQFHHHTPKNDFFTYLKCTNISHTRTTKYAHMHMCNRPPKSGRIKCCHLANTLSLVLFRLRSTRAATWQISCNTYADA